MNFITRQVYRRMGRSYAVRAGVAVARLAKFRKTHRLPFIRPYYSREVGFFNTAIVEPKANQINILFYDQMPPNTAHIYVEAVKKSLGPIYLAWHARDEVERLVCNLSDGDWPSRPGVSFSSNRGEDCLIPDAYFFDRKGFVDEINYYDNNWVDWSERTDDLVWRGGPNGNGHWNMSFIAQGSPDAAQRLQVAHLTRNSKIDFKFLLRPGFSLHDQKFDLLRNEGFIGDRLHPAAWMKKKYALDVDGFTNTWDNLFLRMAMGCCVLKLDSQYGYRQWYYDRLEPFVHYVPVAADGSDLLEKYEWVRTEDKKAEEIAKNGRAFIKSMVFSSEMLEAGERVRESWKSYV